MATHAKAFDATIREAQAEFLAASLVPGDAAFVARTLTDIARETGLGREGLYKALGKSSNPEL